MTTRMLILGRAALNELGFSTEWTYRRRINQRIVGAVAAWEGERSDEWWWVDKEKHALKRVKPQLCVVGDLFIVTSRRTLKPTGITLRAKDVGIARFYADRGFSGPDARVLRHSYLPGTEVIDNPWAWVVTCNVNNQASALS